MPRRLCVPVTDVSIGSLRALFFIYSSRKFLIVTRHVNLYRVFQKDLNIFYSGNRDHRTWHPVIFSYGDTLKTMPTNHKLQDRIRAAVQTIDGNKFVSS